MKILKNKKAVITGGSHGIGKAIATEFLNNGAEIFLIARGTEGLAAAKEELSGLGIVKIISADMSRREDVERASRVVAEAWGSVDILANAAGVYGPIGSVIDVDPEEWKRAIDINLLGVFLSVHFFAPLMKNNAGGSIINFVGGGEGSHKNFSSYVAAKGGIARFTETVAEELKERKILVNAISPGAVNTRFLDEILRAGPGRAGKETYEQSLKQKESGGVSPVEAANLAVFLASAKAEGITGKIFSARSPYETFPEHKTDIMSSDVYTFRRIWPEDRGFDWGRIQK